MCLSKISKNMKLKPVTEGYCALKDNGDGTYSPVCRRHEEDFVIGKPHRAEDDGYGPLLVEMPTGNSTYEPGFHVSHTIEGARVWREPGCDEVMARVRVEEPTATGWQGAWGKKYETTVCQVRTIIEIVETDETDGDE